MNSKAASKILGLVIFFLSCELFAATVSVRISNGNSDAEERIPNGNMSRNSSDLELGYDGGNAQIVGMRFQGVAIPQGATINEAYIEFETDETGSGTTNLLIYGEDTDSAGGIGNNNSNLSSRTPTTATQTWSPSAWNSISEKHQTSSLVSIIQEIVNRGGWSSGNDLMVLIEPGAGCNSSSCRRTAEAYNGESANAPLLFVRFNEAAANIVSVSGACGSDNVLVVAFDATVSGQALDVNEYALNVGTITSLTQQSDQVIVLEATGMVGGLTTSLSFNGSTYTIDYAGLLGRYFDQRSGSGSSKQSYNQTPGLFSGNEYLRLDPEINFSWNNDTPDIFPQISGNGDRFSERWTGFISPDVAGDYEFRLYSDDGMRLSFEGTQIIDDWSLHSPRFSSSSAVQTLTDSDTYEVQVEHFEHTGRAYAQLYWRRDGGAWELVPSTNMTTCPVVPLVLTPVQEYHFDEVSWNGTSGEVEDQSSNNFDATSVNGADTTLDAHLCRAGEFDGVNDYLSTPNIYDTLRGTASLSFWIKTTQVGNNTGWLAPGVAGVEQSGGTDDIFWGWLDASGRIGISVGNDYATKSSVAINDDSFHHVVLTRDATLGVYKIYIDNVLNATGSIATGLIGNSFSSIGRIEDTGGSPVYFRGILDELKVFNYVLNDLEVSQIYSETRACNLSCTLGSFAITQPNYALACPQSRIPVEIEAMCADGVTTKTDYVGTVTLSTNENTESEFYLNASGGAVDNTLDFDGSENGIQTAYLFHKNENSNLLVSADDGTLSSSSLGATDVRTAGFVVSSPANFACGTSSSLSITAIGQDTSGGASCNILTGFDGNKDLKVWSSINIDPAESPGIADSGLPRSLTWNGASVASSQPASNNVSANFSSGVASVSLGYLDVGEVLGLQIRHDDAPYDGSVTEFSALTASVPGFVVYPGQFSVEATSVNAQCSGATESLLGACSAFVSAGSDFEINVSAQCADAGNSLAPSYRGSVGLGHQLVAPSTGNLGALGQNQAIFDGTEPTPGQVTISNQSVSEVGVFSLSTLPGSYFGQSLAGSGLSSANIGRFYPHDFDLSPTDGSFASTCGSFTYIGQGFTYDVVPSVLITARNRFGNTTLNYTDSNFLKLSHTDLTRAFPSADRSQLGGDAATLMSLTTSPNAGALSIDSAGVLEYTFDPGDVFIFDKNSNAEVAPFVSDLEIGLSALADSDGVTSATLPSWEPTGSEQRYGRWHMESVYGAETDTLSMLSQVEYYDASGNYVVNTADSCSDISSALSITDSTGASVSSPFTGIAVGSGSSDMSYNAILLGGLADFSFSPPGLASSGSHSGSIGVTMDFSALPWLQYNWDGSVDGSLENPPSASATFGQYRGHDRVIYWREVPF